MSKVDNCSNFDHEVNFTYTVQKWLELFLAVRLNQLSMSNRTKASC